MRVVTRNLVILTIVLQGLFVGIPSHADRASELNWRSDPLMIASVALPQKTLTLKEACEQLARQTSGEFYVDRRYADVKVALHMNETRVETVMNIMESVTGFRWRLVGDIFLLGPDARGIAVTRWHARYVEAKNSHLARVAESRVREWLYSAMPFPPRVDMPWELTPVQREQIAYQEALSIFTMTPPQLDWLNSALRESGYRSPDVGFPTDMLVQTSPDIPIKMSAALVIDSPKGSFIVEKPLGPPIGGPVRISSKKPARIEPAPSESKGTPKKPSLKQELKGIWLTHENLRDLSGLLKKAKERGIDNLFLPVLESGETIYPSKVLPPAEKKSTSGDRLKQVINVADALGVKVHAVLDATLWGDAAHPVPRPANYGILHERNLLGRTYAEQEEWQRRELRALDPNPGPMTGAGPESKRFYLCPASSQVPRLLRSVVREIASNYQVAGICLDRVDYPKSTPFVLAGRDLAAPFGYTVEVRKEMIRLNQVDPIDVDPAGIRTPEDAEAFALWERFRRGKLTGLLTEVCAAFKAARPDGICSVTLDLASEAQSPAHWSKIAGLDALIPRVQLRPPVDRLASADGASEEDAQAVMELHRAVLKNAAVVPVVSEIRASDFADQVVPVARIVKLAKDDGLKGYILRGDASAIAMTLEALAD